MNYVHFAAEFHGEKLNFSQSTDVTYWEGIKFFKSATKAKAYGKKLVEENIKVNLDPNVFNKLIELNDFRLPYICFNKYKVEGKVTNQIHIVIIAWETPEMGISDVLKCFASKEDAINFVKKFKAKSYKRAKGYEAKVYFSSHNVY